MNIRKYIVLALLGSSIAISNATTVALTVNPNSYTNLITGSAIVKQVILTSQSTNSAFALLIDSANKTNLSYVTLPYTNILSYATNLPVTWVDFYGATNWVTNIALVDISNSVAQTTNPYPIRLSVAAPANSSATFGPINYYFGSGVMVTNTSTNTISISLTYQQ